MNIVSIIISMIIHLIGFSIAAWGVYTFQFNLLLCGITIMAAVILITECERTGSKLNLMIDEFISIIRNK